MSFFSFPSMALLISLIAIASLLSSPTLSTSLDDNNVDTTGFTATLTHVDQGKSLTKTELLRRGIQRATKRVQMRKALMAQLTDVSLESKSKSPSRINAPIRSGYGEFYMNVGLGTPPTNHRAFVDTDTDLIWMSHCHSTSTSYSKLRCSDNLCKKAGSCNKRGVCQYKYQHSNLSTVQVDLATETFQFGGNLKVHKLGFSCVSVEKGDGVVGLGRGPLSLVSQMQATKFSYCLPSYDNVDELGFVLIGSQVKTHPHMITASLVRNPVSPSRNYVKVVGLSVSNVKLPIDVSSFTIQPNGTGGWSMDTGSTVTYLQPTIFDHVKNEVERQIKVKMNNNDDIGLPACFTIPPPSRGSFMYPNITIRFSSSSELVLPIENTFREYTVGKKNITCLAMAVAPASDNGMSSLGNIQQMNTLVVFDLAKNTVGFLQNTKCNKM